MNFICFLNLSFIWFADHDTSWDLINFLFGFQFVIFILMVNYWNGIFYLADLMTFMLFGMLINALHAHNFLLLLTEEDEILFMHMTLCCETVLGTWSVFCRFVIISFRVITGSTASLTNIRGFPLCPNVWETLRITHLFQLPLSIPGFLRITWDDLS